MAYERFEQLKPKKKQIVLDSIKNVLERKNINDVSITDLSDEAEISRATFYTYFIDKNDAVMTLLKYYLETLMKEFVILLQKNNGIFFKAINEGYDELIKIFDNEKAMSFIKNVYYMSDYTVLQTQLKQWHDKFEDFYQWILKNTDLKDKLKNTKEVRTIIEMILSTYSGSLAKLVLGIEKSMIDYGFKYKIKIIEKGI